jgi:hypothetical protein
MHLGVQGGSIMKKYVIEREIPGVGKHTAEGFCEAADQSNRALDPLDGIQWIQSFVTPDKLFCVYLADDEEVIREHARTSGFPATKIHLVRTILDPTSANG